MTSFCPLPFTSCCRRDAPSTPYCQGRGHNVRHCRLPNTKWCAQINPSADPVRFLVGSIENDINAHSSRLEPKKKEKPVTSPHPYLLSIIIYFLLPDAKWTDAVSISRSADRSLCGSNTVSVSLWLGEALASTEIAKLRNNIYL